ncbi:hypothetical protein G6O67_004125 [Ophiocordyceps sinensis]|uniref:Uncharacterized protein n=2 Tax=Ophiocordyceps sinensis TaxID=72228 RepID=A0A8H4LY58_9HYPO|nr:hypothetical protein OCS_06905 [Ophiocordyceps sinensis CO18]KAF4507649.1 hypothetical protein G6O67_004125 [Ophiocordyceps sinensis]
MKYLELVLAACVGLTVGAETTDGSYDVNATNALEVRSWPREEPFWARDEPLFKLCEGLLSGDPCVKELFQLQGSIAMFHRNCETGDLNRGLTIQVNLGPRNYPTHLFPTGPSCGRRLVGTRFVALDPPHYRPVCACVRGEIEG